MKKITSGCGTMCVLASTFLLGSCYIEGGGCNGPFCFGVSTEVCGNGLFCDDNDEANRCPDADDIERESVSLINRVRSNSAGCPMGQHNTVLNNISWSEQLFTAADLHSRDMASNNFIGASGSDGLGVRERLGAVNFPYITQSVAGGYASTGALISAWQSDNQECSKLAGQRATGVALACRFDANSDFGTYWTLVMAGE